MLREISIFLAIVFYVYRNCCSTISKCRRSIYDSTKHWLFWNPRHFLPRYSKWYSIFKFRIFSPSINYDEYLPLLQCYKKPTVEKKDGPNVNAACAKYQSLGLYSFHFYLLSNCFEIVISLNSFSMIKNVDDCCCMISRVRKNCVWKKHPRKEIDILFCGYFM